ncbi:MAG: dehydrogenase [Sphingobacteriales bacterium 44-15]|nr:MAG: dehydrogenase [Sphingobacteriales bacterium 44-15]
MQVKVFFILFFSMSVLLISCHTNSNKNPFISFDTYKVADGFELQLAAAEPLIEAPVAMDFDGEGRMWAVEMRGFMPNLSGIGDTIPNGRISILEDWDDDGVADHSKVFVDSLVLPRAMSLVYGGLLYAAPPDLWFVEINNDKPGKRILVDSLYAVGGSPEAQPNGLMMGIDNWIYSANSNFRYQLRDGKWIKEPTSFRGQFGISQDNYGRLYYNYNSVQIAGDYVLPNTIINNPYLKPKEAINKVLSNDQSVYPLHPTTVNRGYEKGILNKDSLLVAVTASCGPVIYRGDQFPDDYHQNYFVCEPQANLVKRDILTFGAIQTTAKPAWNDKEFIASTDEGFRPVNLNNGPDGAMYVVDMHRGIMEYGAFSTPYYNNGLTVKKLDTLLHKGRILRVKYKDKKLDKVPDLNKASEEALVVLLKSKNGWVRDRAQQLLIFKQQKSVVPELEKLAQDNSNPITAIHALHTLDGLNALSFEFTKKIAASQNPMLSAHALLLLQKNNTKDNVKPMAALANDLLNRKDSIIDLYLALSLGPWAEVSNEAFFPVLLKLSQTYPGTAIYHEAIINSLRGLEEKFQVMAQSNNQKNAYKPLDSLLAVTIKNKQEGKMNSIFVTYTAPVDSRTNGLAIFRSTCATCHGVDGEGIENLAPPLTGSEYVAGSPERLAMIILNGLEGPVHVKGQLYNFNGSMPNFGNNFGDKDISDIIEYLQNCFVSTPVKSISAKEINGLRNKKQGTLTEKDLLDMPDKIKDK